MIILDYKLNESELPRIKKFNLSEVTASDLDYYLFCGNIFFKIGGKNFDALWNWIPVIDFATQLYLISTNLIVGQCKSLYFTESEATIKFCRKENIISVAPSYVFENAEIDCSELQEASKEFLGNILESLSTSYPQLLENAPFLERLNLLEQG